MLAVRRGQALIALVPLTRGSSGAVSFTRLEFLGTGSVASDYLDIIARTGCETEAREALREYLRAHKSTLQFDHVRTPGSIAECVAERLSEDGWVAESKSIGVCPFIRLEGHTWDSLLGTLGSSHRYNVRRRIRALSTNFDMRFELVTAEDRRREAFPALVTLHNERWAERGGTAFHTQASRDFHDHVTRLALERGWLRLYVLTLNGATAAVQYLLGYKGRFYFYQHGYDSQYGNQSVGLVSFALAIRAAIEEGASEFDMLWGDESYKQLWAHDSRTLLRIDLFPPGLGGRVQRRTLEVNRAIRSLARRLLKRAGRERRGR